MAEPYLYNYNNVYKRKRTGINQSYSYYLIFAETPPIASRSSAIAELPLERIKPVRITPALEISVISPTATRISNSKEKANAKEAIKLTKIVI